MLGSTILRGTFRRISQLWDNAHTLNLENCLLYLLSIISQCLDVIQRKIILFYYLIAWQRTHSNQPQLSEVFKKLPWSHGKGISQRNLAMKVLEPIPLQTAGFVQACQHLLDFDLFTCRSQMLLSVQSPREAVRCTFPKHSLSKPQGFIDRRQSLLNDGHSQQDSKRCWRTKGKAWSFA